MKRIAIIGANGQVGTEVCLYLNMLPGVDVIPVCRSEISATHLRRLGLDPRIGSIGGNAGSARLLEGCDTVADFSLPTGSTTEVKRAMRDLIPNLAKYAPPEVPLIYLSSITAFGIPDFHHELRAYRISRNRYGTCKRFGESLAFQSARRNARPAYALRIGVVHGELQAVSRKLLRDIRGAGSELACLPQSDSYTIFSFTIAEALAGIALGKEKPGLYTALSSPAWTWENLHRYFAERAGVDPKIAIRAAEHERGSGLKDKRSGALAPMARFAARYKDLLNGYVAALSPTLEENMRAIYHGRSAANEIAAMEMSGQWWPYGCNYSAFPGKRLQSVTDSRTTMEPYAAELRKVVKAAGASSDLVSVKRLVAKVGQI